MHFRVSTKKKNGKTYRYGQFVQSYRRDDGMPAHRVLANLGPVTEQEADNLRLVCRANREGRALVLAPEAADAFAGRKVQVNCRYLDLAVLLDLWKHWELGQLLDELVPDSNVEVPVRSVLAALVLQRCVAPDSKLAAVDWFAGTALPELLHVHPARFNNTRIHRSLDALEIIERPLQQKLARRIAHSNGPLRVLYLDCTDTWFVGQGPELASKGLTKEGLFKRQIGIALLCNGDGLPLRWATVEGRHDERKTMFAMIRDVAEETWAQQVPFVMDRAMGSAATVRALGAAGVRFVTAVPMQEFPAYSDRIPLGRFDDLCAEGEALDAESHRAKLAARARELGMEPTKGGRFLLDLGPVSRDGARSEETLSRARASLLLALRAAAELQEHGVAVSDLASRWGIHRGQLHRYQQLLALTSSVRERVLAGDADRLTTSSLEKIAALSPVEQQDALEAAIAEAGSGPPRLATGTIARLCAAGPLQVRAVISFRPDLFIQQRTAAEERLAAFVTAVADINERLRSPHSRRDANSALGEVAAVARKMKLTGVVDIDVSTTREAGAELHQVSATVDEDAWSRRRAADGINLVIAHRDQLGSAQDLVDLYFDKDKVEKCFRTIKSVLQLRPVHHRTDHKVRAHVSLCVLALLLERTLERRLRSAGLKMTAPTANGVLAACTLNRFDDIDPPIYTTTATTPDQRVLLRALDLEELVDDHAVARTIHPR